MAALIEDRDTPMRELLKRVLPVAATTTIYAGSIVCLDASGNAVPGADTAGLVVAGRAEEYVYNAWAAAAKAVEVRCGTFLYAGSGFTQADVGKRVFVIDDQTVALTSTNHVIAGKIVDFESATAVWVEIETDPKAATVAPEATANATTQTAAYVQADVQSIATLANALKGTVNAILTAVKNAGIMA